jgi:hypothetical protein
LPADRSSPLVGSVWLWQPERAHEGVKMVVWIEERVASAELEPALPAEPAGVEVSSELPQAVREAAIKRMLAREKKAGRFIGRAS